MEVLNTVIHGYSEREMSKIPDESIDVVFTSPPYAERRKETYGGIKSKDYIEWFTPIASEIKRVLKPTGSFFLNIKHHTENGERDLYVFELVIHLKKALGFRFVDDFAWTKTPYPGGLAGRFKNGWEPIYHFTKLHPKHITFNPTACGTKIKEESKKRAKRKQNGLPSNGSRMGHIKGDNLMKIEISRPSNVIHANNVSNQYMLKSDHSATFPVKLPEFFLKSFANEGGVILDPFAGSGTTAIAAINCKMNWIMIEKEESNVDLIIKNINTHTAQLKLF